MGRRGSRVAEVVKSVFWNLSRGKHYTEYYAYIMSGGFDSVAPIDRTMNIPIVMTAAA